MKKLIVLSAFLLSLKGFSQEEQAVPVLNCYNKWAAKFEDRGAENVKDGVYDNVIITNRQGSKAVCNNGKVEVINSKVTKFYILLNDGTYEEVKRSWKPGSYENVTIVNGISKTIISVHGELINILWPAMIKPKKSKPTIAPDPTDD